MLWLIQASSNYLAHEQSLQEAVTLVVYDYETGRIYRFICIFIVKSSLIRPFPILLYRSIFQVKLNETTVEWKTATNVDHEYFRFERGHRIELHPLTWIGKCAIPRVNPCGTITPTPLIKMDENTPFGEPTLERLFVSFRFHYLLSSTNSMWMI